MTLANSSDVRAEPASLTFRRLKAGEAPALSHALGGRWLGAAEGALHAALLAPEGPVFDAWVGGSAVQEHRHGCVRYVTDGQWLHGYAELDEKALGLEAASHRAYVDLFAALAASPCQHLVRLWNYFADINVETGGMERYRQFNAGRHQAFIDSQQSAFEGSPAACALGTQSGPLQVYFLAGRQPPVAIENPRQVSAYRYPETYGPRPPTFSRAALADVGNGAMALFISGTASIVGHTSIHLGDVRRQAEESLANIAVLQHEASQRAGVDFPLADLHCTVYLRHPADLSVVREVVERILGPSSAAARNAVYLQADVCREELLVEIEANSTVNPRSAH